MAWTIITMPFVLIIISDSKRLNAGNTGPSSVFHPHIAPLIVIFGTARKAIRYLRQRSHQLPVRVVIERYVDGHWGDAYVNHDEQANFVYHCKSGRDDG